jgi:putative ABC transport system permease protein
LAIIFIASLLIGLLGTMLLRSFEQSILTIGAQSNAKITVFTTDLEQSITAGQIKSLHETGNINFVNRVNEITASPDNFEISISHDEDVTTAGVRLQGFDDLSRDSLFGQNTIVLLAGSLALRENEIIIHQLLAVMNGVAIGDSISFNNSGIAADGVIAGVYTFVDAEIRNEENTPSTFRFENLIFTHTALINQLQGKEGYAEAHFYVKDPNAIQDTRNIFEREMRQTVFEVRVSDALYRRIAAPLSQTAGLTTIILVITGIGVLVVVSLLLTIWSRERRKETALLMSIGERNVNIVMQRLVEVMAIYLLAFGLVIPIVFVTAPFMGGFYQSAVGLADIDNLTFAMSSVDVISVFSVGVIALITAITLSCFSIMRLSPKTLLSRND